MKKILWVILSLMFVLTGFGCSAPAVTIDMSKPWHGVYEKATYEVSYYYFLKNDQSANEALKDKIIKDPLENSQPKIQLGSGTLDYIIEQVDPNVNTWKLSTSLTMTYLPESDFSQDVMGTEYDEFNRVKNYIGLKNFGTTDTMSSFVVFNMSQGKLFRPVSVTKTYNALTYSFDYTTRKFTYKFSDKDEQNKTFKAKEVKSGYDNEELFLFVRALDKNTYGTGSSLSISPVYNWTDAAQLNAVASYSINMSIAKETKTIPVTDSFMPYVENMVNDDKRLECYDVTLSKASTNQAGADLKVWYSKMGITDNDIYADKLMIKAVQNTMDVGSVRKIFSVSYDIASLEIR